MASESDLQHLTAFEDNDRLEELKDRTPEDRIDFRLLYDPEVVNPWSEGPNELVRLYFNADRLDGFYVPVDFAERLEDDVRSTPIDRPTTDDEDEGDSWDEVGGDYRVQQDVEIGGNTFDLLWYHESEDGDEAIVVATEIADGGQ